MVRFFLRWTRFHRPLVFMLTGAVALTIVLAAAGPFLLDNVQTAALRRSLVNASQAAFTAGHIRVSLTDDLPPAAAADLDDLVTGTAQTLFTPLLQPVVASATLPPLIPWLDGRLQADRRLELQVFNRDSIDREGPLTLTSGRWPTPADSADPDVIPAVVGQPLAASLGLSPGSRLPLNRQISGAGPDLWIEVVGIAQAADPEDPFWNGSLSPLAPRHDGRHLRLGALIEPALFDRLAADYFPGQPLRLDWFLLLDHDQITPAMIPALQERLPVLESRLKSEDQRFRVDSTLPAVLADFAGQAAQIDLPLQILAWTAALLALLFVAIAGSLAANLLEAERHLLRSRGTGARRLFTWQGSQLVGITLLALLAAAPLGWALVAILVRTGPLAAIRDPRWALTWPAASLTAALLGALFSIGVLLWPLGRVIFQPAEAPTRRSEAPPWWQRVQADLLLTLLGLVLTLRTLWTRDLSGTAGAIDWLSLAAPLALLFGGTTLLLRAWPPLVERWSRRVVPGARLAPFLALVYTGRDSERAVRLVLLFALTIALGITATSLDEALAVNEALRARHAAGGARRLTGIDAVPDLAAGAFSGPDTTAVWRGEGSFETLINGAYATFEILAIDGNTFDQVPGSPDGLTLASLQSPGLSDHPPRPAIPLPDGSQEIGIWLFLSLEDPIANDHFDELTSIDLEAAWQGVDLDVKLAAAGGPTHLLSLADSGRRDDRWRFFAASLPDEGPWLIDSIWLRSRQFQPEFRHFIAADDLTAVTAGGQPVVLESFTHDDERVWFSLDGHSVGVTREVGGRADPARFEIRRGFQTLDPSTWYGFGPAAHLSGGSEDDHPPEPPPDEGFPALVSPRFAAFTGLKAGDPLRIRLRVSTSEGILVPLVIAGEVAHFPTLYDSGEAGYIVIQQDPLFRLINDSRRDVLLPNELLIADPAAAALAFDPAGTPVEVVDAAALVRALQAFPLAVGLRSAAWLSAILAMVISLGGFAAQLVHTAVRRRRQLAVLHALGLSSRQLGGILLGEHLLLVGLGLLIGSAAGLLFSWLLLHNFNFDWGGPFSEPAFQVAWNWAAIGRFYLLFGALILASLVLVVLFARRIGLGQALRLGVE